MDSIIVWLRIVPRTYACGSSAISAEQPQILLRVRRHGAPEEACSSSGCRLLVAYPRAELLEASDDVLVTTTDVVDIVDTGLALGDEAGQDQTGARTNIQCADISLSLIHISEPTRPS